MFDKGRETYRSDLVLGERYQDKGTGIMGKLVAIAFYEHACERGTLRYLDANQQMQEVSFDAPEMVHVASGVAATERKTGGPDRGGVSRSTPARR